MSVVKRVQVIPNRVAILFHFLKQYSSGMKVNELEALLSPAALGPAALSVSTEEEESGGSTPHVVLREARYLGLVCEVGNQHVAVPEDLRGMGDADLLDYLEQRLTHPDKASQCDQARVPEALAWLLAQDPARGLPWTQIPSWALEQKIEAYDITNNSRYQNVGYWARYLGYAWRIESGRDVNLLFPDPTEALERHLRAILRKEPRMHIADLVTNLAVRGPVFEGGVVRQEVEAKLPEHMRRPDKSLSSSTSLALLRLWRRGVIRVESVADAKMMLLSTWTQSQPVSHVELLA